MVQLLYNSDVDSAITEVNATAGIGTVTLADGTDGQVKTFINTSTSGTNIVTITPTNLRGYASILLNAEGETVTCIFKNSKCNILAGNGLYNCLIMIGEYNGPYQKNILKMKEQLIKKS